MLDEVKRRGLKIGDDVRSALEMLESNYGARLTHDSGHKTGPTWILTLPNHASAQVAVRMNINKLTLYLRDKTLDARQLRPLISQFAEVEKVYPNAQNKNPPSSLLNTEHAPFLTPSSSNQIIRICPQIDTLKNILDIYLSISAKVTVTIPTAAVPSYPDQTAQSTPVPISPPVVTTTPVVIRTPATTRPISAEELRAQLDRNSETGRRGEEIAYAEELVRLMACGCRNPKDYVELTAETHVGCGFDIASRWPGHERFIEVKTTTAAGSDFFLSENERATLSELSEQAWIYRVELTADGSGYVSRRIRNPIAHISAEAMRPVVWRINADALDEHGN